MIAGEGLPRFLEIATLSARKHTHYCNRRKKEAMRRLSCSLALILALAVPSLGFGAEPQDKEGTQITKQGPPQSMEHFKDQKKKEFERFKQQLKETTKEELQE
jgi:hypothetical protein